MRPRAILTLTTLILTILLAAGCDRHEADPTAIQTTGDIVLGDRVLLVERTPYTLVGVAGDIVTVATSGTPDIVVGDILLGESGAGFLRRVAAVQTDGQLMVCTTGPAALVDAISRGTCRDTLALFLEAPADKSPKREGGRLSSFAVTYQADGVTLADGGLQLDGITLCDGLVEGTQVQATLVEGRLDFAPELTLFLSIDAAILREYLVAAAGGLTFAAELEFSADGPVSLPAEPVRLYSATHTFAHDFGPLPVITEVTLDIYAGVDAELTTAADIDLTAAHLDEVALGVRWLRPLWRRHWEMTAGAGPGEAAWQDNHAGRVRCWVEPRFSLRHYGVAGPDIRPRPYVSLATTSDDFWWTWRSVNGWDLDLAWPDTAAAVASLDPDLAPADDLGLSAADTLLTGSGERRIAGLILVSEPAGASVMMDGSSAGIATPDTLDYVDLGPHELRTWLEGYNEDFRTVSYAGGFQTVSVTLAVPRSPRPVIAFTTPENGAAFTDNVIQVAGTIGMSDESAFDGDSAVMRLNGIDQIIAVSAGAFLFETGILSGANELLLRATSLAGDTGVSEHLALTGDFLPDDIVVQLSWDSPHSDMDLHVWNPMMEHCYYGHKVISEGSLDIDDVDGYGPETFTATQARLGQYMVYVNSYGLHGDAQSACSVTIWLSGGMPTTYGPYVLDVADANGSNPEAWWQVSVFRMEDGQKTATLEPVTPEQLARIRGDMASLPAKR